VVREGDGHRDRYASLLSSVAVHHVQLHVISAETAERARRQNAKRTSPVGEQAGGQAGGQAREGDGQFGGHRHGIDVDREHGPPQNVPGLVWPGLPRLLMPDRLVPRSFHGCLAVPRHHSNWCNKLAIPYDSCSKHAVRDGDAPSPR